MKIEITGGGCPMMRIVVFLRSTINIMFSLCQGFYLWKCFNEKSL